LINLSINYADKILPIWLHLILLHGHQEICDVPILTTGHQTNSSLVINTNNSGYLGPALDAIYEQGYKSEIIIPPNSPDDSESGYISESNWMLIRMIKFFGIALFAISISLIPLSNTVTADSIILKTSTNSELQLVETMMNTEISRCELKTNVTELKQGYEKIMEYVNILCVD